MSPPLENVESRLDPDANRQLSNALDALRRHIVADAAKLAPKGVAISEDDVHAAYTSVLGRTPESTVVGDAQATISQALKENQVVEWVSYCMAITWFLVGLALLLIGALTADVPTRLGFLSGGTIVQLLILAPVRIAMNSRRHNIAIRMLGIILSRVQDPKDLAPLLKESFLRVVLGVQPNLDATSE